MKSRNLYPDSDILADEQAGALYPSINDKQFLQKLLKKREFAESKADPFKMVAPGETDPCSTDESFQITQVQKFLANLLSPRTPYNSALFYHGTGVGKTQAAVQVAEGILEMYPRKKILVIAPVTIQPGFFRNIFDITRVTIGTGDNDNTANQGTGDLYMRLTGTLKERNPSTIERKVKEAINRRYTFFGYLAFRNYIRKILEKRIGKTQKSAAATTRVLREEFSNRVIIIDEAHHLRDEESATEEDEELDTTGAGGKTDADDTAAGSQLVPFLKKVLMAAEGIKLVLMTATPMYNTAREIVTLLNLLLLNDKKATLTVSQLFDAAGNIRKNSSSLEMLHNAASAYISFMRGENPRTFPIRLTPNPKIVYTLKTYPTIDPGGRVQITEEERTSMLSLPIVESELSGTGLDYIKSMMAEEISEGAATSGRYGIRTRDRLIQAGNILFPVDDDRIGESGFTQTFRKEGTGIAIKYKCKEGIEPSWLAEENVGEYSPKALTILNLVKSAKGVQFLYSRFVASGALFLALMLEANGYTLHGRAVNLFADGIQSPGGRQCALCELKERGHTGGHTFVPAKYVLLTGNDEISPKNSDSIAAARASNNVDGRQVKIVIGSQVASEGVDLRFIREIHIFDSWYHLNKTDQVIGRGIRYCSHSLLPFEDRNCTIHLHVVTFAGVTGQETMDLYSYRMAMKKAKQIGEVARILKQYALDCNLNREAIQIIGQPPVRIIDSQGGVRENVNINDAPFSPLCDWLEQCEYKCIPDINIDLNDTDDTTYDEFSAKYRESLLKKRVREIFRNKNAQSFYYAEDFLNMFNDVPRQAFGLLLTNILGNKNFRIQHNNINGYLIYRNGLFLFQPYNLKDESIPLVLRTTYFPIKRDYFEPAPVEIVPIENQPREDTGVEIDDKWGILVEWIRSILSGTVDEISNKVDTLIHTISGENDKLYKRLKQELEIILEIPKFFKKRAHLENVLLEFVFDEWLNQKEQETVIKAGDDHGSGKEHKIRVGSLKILRFVNVKNGEIDYKNEDGTNIPKSVMDIIKSSTTDEVLLRQANISTTGAPYGFITTKGGESFVFKQGKPVKSGVKPARGAECANVSETSDKIKHLREIIGIFGQTNVDDNTFNRIITKKSIQLCAVTDIFLRLMDAQQTKGLRWFFRPVSAAASGHVGKA